MSLFKSELGHETIKTRTYFDNIFLKICLVKKEYLPDQITFWKYNVKYLLIFLFIILIKMIQLFLRAVIIKHFIR